MLLAFLFAVHAGWAEPPAATSGLPFWKAKEKVYARIREREIVVSVKSVATPKAEPRRHHLTVAGGGLVEAPPAFVFARARNYEELLKTSGFVRSARFDAEKKQLDFEIGALGYTGRFRVRLDAREEGERRQILWEVLGGAMNGFHGRFDFAKDGQDSRQTEIGITGDFLYDRFPLARVFLEFGMEVVFQRMALRMRADVEHRYRESLPK